MLSLAFNGRTLCGGAITAIVAGLLVRRGVPVDIGLARGLVWGMLASGGFFINDWFDADKDRISHPQRLIPRGVVPRRTVFVGGVVLVGLAVVFASTASSSYPEWFMYVGGALGVLSYSWLAVRIPTIKAAISASLCTLPVVALIYSGVNERTSWSVALGVWCFILGREIVMDVADIRADAAVGMRTLPVILGRKRAAVLGFQTMLCGLTIAMPAAWLAGPLAIGAVVIGVTIVLGGLAFWPQSDSRAKRQIIIAMWLPMVLGVWVLL